MPLRTEYRVISEREGHITERNTRQSAEECAAELNSTHGLPSDHYVEEHTEEW